MAITVGHTEYLHRILVKLNILPISQTKKFSRIGFLANLSNMPIKLCPLKKVRKPKPSKGGAGYRWGGSRPHGMGGKNQ